MKRLDPLALAFFGGALALLAGLLLYVVFFKTPEPAQPARAFDFVERLRSKLEGTVDQPRPPRTPAQELFKTTPAQTPPPPAHVPAILQPGRSWRYRVDVEPPVWRDASLTYRTQRESAGLGVVTNFVHAAGRFDFHLGIFEAGHPSHANTRFPGFFMYAAYLQPPFTAGKPVVFGWPWQSGSSNRPGPGRMKRFEGQVVGWEHIQVEAGTYRAVKIDGWLRYLEADGNQFTRVAMVFWFAPKIGQVVKILLQGKPPDENLNLIVAELVEYR